MTQVITRALLTHKLCSDKSTRRSQINSTMVSCVAVETLWRLYDAECLHMAQISAGDLLQLTVEYRRRIAVQHSKNL